MFGSWPEEKQKKVSLKKKIALLSLYFFYPGTAAASVTPKNPLQTP